MQRSTSMAALLLGILFSAESFAEGPESKTYFPTKVGAKWVYSYDGKEETEVVTAAVKKGEALIVTVRRTDRFGKVSESQLKVSEEGLFRLTGGPAVKHPPMCLLKLPHKAGSKWNTFTGAWGLFESEVTAHGPEKLKVPAGEFEAIRVETAFPQREGEDIIGKYWYAPGIGLVKQTHGEYVRILKSFTPGKE